MEKDEEIKFVIPAFSPETMPLDRLIEYLEQIAVVLGAAEGLHLVRIEKSSTRPVFRMDRSVADLAKQNALLVSHGGGSVPQRDAVAKISRMVRRDAGDQVARLTSGKRTLIKFRPAPLPPPTISGIRQLTEIDGVLIRLGGAGPQVTLQLQQASGEILSHLVAPKALAKEMARSLFEPVRLSGQGDWERDSKDGWKLSRMLVQSCLPLDHEDIITVVERMRSANVHWPAEADGKLIAERKM